MKFAVSYSTPYYGVDSDRIMAYAQHAEACGFESLYAPEHIRPHAAPGDAATATSPKA